MKDVPAITNSRVPETRAARPIFRSIGKQLRACLDLIHEPAGRGCTIGCDVGVDVVEVQQRPSQPAYPSQLLLALRRSWANALFTSAGEANSPASASRRALRHTQS